MDGNFKAVLLKSVMKEECPLSPFLFSPVLRVLAEVVKLEKVIKRRQTWKDEAKLSRFADDVRHYTLIIQKFYQETSRNSFF